MLDKFKSLDTDEYRIKLNDAAQEYEVKKAIRVLIRVCRRNEFCDLDYLLLGLQIKIVKGEVIYDEG